MTERLELQPHDTGLLVARRPQAFTAPRGERIIFAAGRRVTVKTSGERILHLPNGTRVRVSVDDSGCATQIEENDALHAIARPHSINVLQSLKQRDQAPPPIPIPLPGGSRHVR